MVCEKREARVVRGNKVSRLGAYLIRENREAEGDEEIGSASLFVAEDLQVTKKSAAHRLSQPGHGS